MSKIPYRYISIEGNIGTGKTTLCEKVHNSHSCTLILEEFAQNPFLPFFYENPERYAFPLELFFMTERFKQMELKMNNQDLFSDFILSDYMFIKTLLFAKINLKDTDFKIFEKLWRTLQASLPKPDLVIYLHRNVERLLFQIKKRGRSYEQKIQADYLQKIQDEYFSYFKTEWDFPVVIIDLGDIDFLKNKAHFDEIERAMRRKYTTGTHHISLVN